MLGLSVPVRDVHDGIGILHLTPENSGDTQPLCLSRS